MLMKKRKKVTKRCLAVVLSFLMLISAITPVNAAQVTPTSSDVEITKNIKDIQTAGFYSAALMNNGDLWTWGSMAAMDKYNAIDSTLYKPKTPAIFMKNVKEFVFTDTYYAAIKNDGTLWMWGCDTNGELGIGACEVNNTVPKQVKIPERVKKVILSNKGWNKSAAITEDGNLYMWGNNSSFGLGIGEDSSNSKNYNTPQKVNGISEVCGVSVSGETTTALTNSGEVYVWGNAYGYTDSLTHSTPERIKNIENISDKIVKVQYTQAGYTALTSKGDLYAWYYSYLNEDYAGRKDSEDKALPRIILSNVKSYESGTTSFAITNSGELYSWGSNEKGETGTGSYGNDSGENYYVSKPTKMSISNVKEIVKTENFKGISGAYAAITNDKKLYMWGSNDFGIFGNGKGHNTGHYASNNYYLVEPKPVKIADNVKTAAYYSYERVFYLKNDKSLWANGLARYGVQGDFDTKNVSNNIFHLTPVLVTLKKQTSNVGSQTKPSTSKPVVVTTTRLTKVQNLKGKKAKIIWKKNTKVTGYQVQYCLKKNFKSGVKTVNIKKNKTTTTTIKKLKKKKTYYVRIRCFKKSGKKTIYSKWSSMKSVKIKK